MTKREAFSVEWERIFFHVCAFSIGDMDGQYRSKALDALGEVREIVFAGLSDREAERKREEDVRILKAYRDGRLKA